MTILGIETATIVCSTALVRDGAVLSTASIAEPFVHSSKLIDQIEEVLAGANSSLSDVEAIAVSIGPGSFTGLRVGLSVAKGLGMALGKQLLPVSTLGGLARGAKGSREWGGRGLLLAALDARKGEIYNRWYEQNKSGEIEPVSKEKASSVKSLLEDLAGRSVVVTGNSTQVREAAGTLRGIRFLSDATASCSAAAIALEGESAYLRGEGVDPPHLEPKYIKEFREKADMVMER